MVITGVPYGPSGKTVWAYAHSPTYQEPSIMYLTGINQNNVVLLLDPKSKVSTEILFLGRKDRIMEFWEGVRFGVGDKESLKEVQSVTGIKDVRDIEELSTAESAEALSVSAGVIKTRLHRARLALKTIIESEIGVHAAEELA